LISATIRRDRRDEPDDAPAPIISAPAFAKYSEILQ